MALGGDKGWDMPGPPPLPAPPVLLSPRPLWPRLLVRTKGRTAGFHLSRSCCFVGSFLAFSVFGKHLWQRGALRHLCLYAAGIKARNYLLPHAGSAWTHQNPSRKEENRHNAQNRGSAGKEESGDMAGKQRVTHAARPQREAQPVTSDSPFLMPLGALGISTAVTAFPGPHHQQNRHFQG